MGNTTSNHNRTIATKGSSHFARAFGAIDVCHQPLPPKPYVNFIPTTKLAKGQTVITKIEKQPIWTAIGEIGPKSSLPHPPHSLGLISGKPHQGEATPITYSFDCIIEGNGVVRHNDITFQNSKNTIGKCDEAGLPPGSPEAIAFLKAKCTLTKLTGKDDKGRELGYPGQKSADPPYYLEIKAQQTVDFISKRVDITEEPQVVDPACGQVPDHTTWLITRTGGNKPKVEKTHAGKLYTLDTSVTSLHPIAEMAVPGKGMKAGSSGHPLGGKTGTFADPGDAAGDTADSKGKAKKYDNSRSSKVAVEGAITSLKGLYEFYQYWRDPCVIKVQAQACGGPKNAELRLFPRSKVDFKLSLATDGAAGALKGNKAGQTLRNLIAMSVKKVKKITDVIAKICRLGGYTFTFKFLEGLELAFEMEYLHCDKTLVGEWNQKLYTPAHVGLKWKFELVTNPMLEFGIEIPISLINFILPGIGETAAYWLRKLRIKADLVFTASLGFNVNVAVGRDKHNEITDQGGGFSIEPKIGAKLALGAGINIATFYARFDGKFHFQIFVGTAKDVLMAGKYSGEIQPVVGITFLEDSWFEKTFEAKPESWKISLGESQKWPLLKMP